jgi:acyl-CoA hydrolase
MSIDARFQDTAIELELVSAIIALQVATSGVAAGFAADYAFLKSAELHDVVRLGAVVMEVFSGNTTVSLSWNVTTTNESSSSARLPTTSAPCNERLVAHQFFVSRNVASPEAKPGADPRRADLGTGCSALADVDAAEKSWIAVRVLARRL